MKNARRRLIAAAGFVLLGCEATPEPPQPYEPRSVREVASFEVRRGGAQVGAIRHLEIEHPTDPVAFYRVENLAGQWLGYVDASGRVYRYPAFAAREEFVGVYPMDEGVAILFDAGAEPGGGIEIRAAAAEADDRPSSQNAAPEPADARKRLP